MDAKHLLELDGCAQIRLNAGVIEEVYVVQYMAEEPKVSLEAFRRTRTSYRHLSVSTSINPKTEKAGAALVGLLQPQILKPENRLEAGGICIVDAYEGFRHSDGLENI
ncbi:hypothetical protein J1614_011179 [Plenodomus biglobosus]|nr:hypothetical protein J1614_011179 [Plenodomus biglobosus]